MEEEGTAAATAAADPQPSAAASLATPDRRQASPSASRGAARRTHHHGTPATTAAAAAAAAPTAATAASGRKPHHTPDARGSVFKSSTPRFQHGDIMAAGGVRLLAGSEKRAEAVGTGTSPQRAAAAAAAAAAATAAAAGAPPPHHHHQQQQQQQQAATRTHALRKRHPRPTRWAVDQGDGRAECVGRAACDGVCAAVADSTVWVAERDGALTIREKEGSVFAVVERGAAAPRVTALLYAPAPLGGGRVLLGHADGSVAALDAATAEPRAGNPALAGGAVTALKAVYNSHTTSLGACGADDGTACLFDLHTLQRVSETLVHPDAVTCVECSGPYVYTGCADGCVRKWDGQTGLEVSCHAVGAAGGGQAVADLLLSGRYLFACVRGSPRLAVIDTASGQEVEPPPPPTEASATAILAVGQHIWVTHDDGVIVVWNAQTLEYVRSMQSSASAPVTAALRVPTVPEDYEVWTLTGDGLVHMWRNHEYTLPVWCADAYQTWSGQLEEAQEDAARMKAELDAASERAAHLEEANARLQSQLSEQFQLQQDVQGLAAERAHDAGLEGERRRRVEAELGDLRQCVTDAHRELAPPAQHLLHYKPADVQGVVAWLAAELRRAEAAAGETAGLRAVAAAVERAAEAEEGAGGGGGGGGGGAAKDKKTPTSPGELCDVVDNLVLSLDACRRKLASKYQEEEVVVAEGGATAAAAAAEEEAAQLRRQNAELEEDKVKLKEMLERLKASHKRVNAQLQALTTQQGD